ncbi:hypothetical protein F5Y18DRAFT_423297 [Xylariaceae sp. FL1019]|nr:hypothetical protein F5Y18DRAFT_423297 [Xylariaceae sp. FL1019]
MPGGVCAKLDYETDMMAEYVADMATRVVLDTLNATPAFRKFVNGILTSTRLPSTTVLLGMNYLAKYVNTHKQRTGSFIASEGELWKLLTVALLLGSKFFDDNTFQNRSWSDVSGIAVADLNKVETQWLRDISWSLYLNPDRSRDYNAWLSNWKEHEEGKKQQQQSQTLLRERLAPIVTTVQKDNHAKFHHPLAYEGWTAEEIAEYERANIGARLGHVGKYYHGQEPHHWNGQWQRTWSQAPLTPPDSGYGTPEYLNSAASVNSHYDAYFNQGLMNGNYGRGYHPNTGHHSYSSSRSGPHHQSFANHYHQNGWDAHMGDCNCSSCVVPGHSKAPPYYHGHGYNHSAM